MMSKPTLLSDTTTTMTSHAVNTAQRVLQYYVSFSYYASVPTVYPMFWLLLKDQVWFRCCSNPSLWFASSSCLVFLLAISLSWDTLRGLFFLLGLSDTTPSISISLSVSMSDDVLVPLKQSRQLLMRAKFKRTFTHKPVALFVIFLFTACFLPNLEIPVFPSSFSLFQSLYLEIIQTVNLPFNFQSVYVYLPFKSTTQLSSNDIIL